MIGMEQGLIIAPERCAALSMRRELATNNAIMSKLSPIEQSVFVASTAKVVAEYTPVELASELANAIKWISKDIGCREQDAADKQYTVIRISEIMKRYYPLYSMKDFRMAFEMAVAGELDSYLPVGRDGMPDKNHYQQFNADYVCKIMNAYKDFRNSVLKKAKDAAPKVEQKPDLREANNSIRRKICAAYLYFKYHGRLPEWITTIGELTMYETLVSIGFADEIVVADDVRVRIYASEYDEMIAKLDFVKANKAKELRENAEIKAYRRERRKRIENAFSWMSSNEIQVQQYLTFER